MDFKDNSEEFSRQIDEGIKRASTPVALEELFNDEFMARYTQFPNWKTMCTQATLERLRAKAKEPQ